MLLIVGEVGSERLRGDVVSGGNRGDGSSGGLQGDGSSRLSVVVAEWVLNTKKAELVVAELTLRVISRHL